MGRGISTHDGGGGAPARAGNRSTAMDDGRIWRFEESLWTGDAEHYRASIDDQCLMVLPQPPFVMSGQQAIEAVAHTPRWSKVDLPSVRSCVPRKPSSSSPIMRERSAKGA